MQRLICFAIALLATSTAAAAPATLAKVKIQLWPEYDRSAMLVMIEVELPVGATLPAVVPLQIPAAAGEPHAVAKRGADNRLYKASYTRSVQGAWATLDVTTDNRRFRVEYYDKLVIKAAARSYHLEWPAPPKIEALELSVQVPLAAKKLSTQPKARQVRKGSRGLTYQRRAVGGHAAGQPLRFDVTYENESGRLSVDLLGKQSSGPATAGAPQVAAPNSAVAPPSASAARDTPATQDDPFMRWLLIGLVIAGVLFVVVMVRGGKSEEPTADKPSLSKPTASKPSVSKADKKTKKSKSKRG